MSSGKKKGVRRFENGFEVHELAMGAPNGKLAKAGKRVAMRYVGRLKSNGKVFDKSTGKPFTFRLGEYYVAGNCTAFILHHDQSAVHVAPAHLAQYMDTTYCSADFLTWMIISVLA